MSALQCGHFAYSAEMPLPPRNRWVVSIAIRERYLTLHPPAREIENLDEERLALAIAPEPPNLAARP